MYLWYMKKVINEAVFSSPLDNTSVNSKFGPRWGRSHNGVDLAANAANVKSPLDGVVDVGEIRNDSCGGTIIITHPDGFKTGYCHMQKINVRSGQKVRKGDIIGVSGGGANDPGRGRSDGRHLHFTLRKDGKLVDPMQYIDKVNVSSSDISFSGATPSKDGDGKTNWDDFFNKDTSKLLDKVVGPKKSSDPLLAKILKPLEDALNLKTEMMESLPVLSEQYSLQNGSQYSSYEYIIRQGKDLKSPEKGIVTFVGNDSTCRNTIIIRHEIERKTFYTQFCNVEFPKISNNEKVSKGQKLGSSSSNIIATVLDKSKSKIKFKDVELIGSKVKDKKVKDKKEKEYDSPNKRTSNSLLSLLTKPFDALNFDNVKTSSEVDQVPEYKWVDWIKKNITTTSKNESIERNINKIKKLL
jgi:murein DD-endopeptidase MepM/ murein hydrolase activator NlpD